MKEQYGREHFPQKGILVSNDQACMGADAAISASVCAHWGEHYHLTSHEVAQYRLWIVARNARLAQVANGYVVPAVQVEQSFEEIARTIADLRSQVSSAGLPEWVRACR